MNKPRDFEFVDILKELNPDKPAPCLGGIYRAAIVCKSKPHAKCFEVTFRLVKDKKLSCPGCEQCGWETDGAIDDYFDCYDGLVDMTDIRHNKLYRLVMDTYIGSGECPEDNYDIRVEEVEEADIPDYSKRRSNE